MSLVIDMQSRVHPLESYGNHVHSCPLCYEHVPCESLCAVEPDLTLDDGTLRGSFHTCDECSEGAR
jgi:hypothetical protein